MKTQSLQDNEAQMKLTSLVQKIQTAMLVTQLGEKPLNAVPMTTKIVDKKGNIWFLSTLASDHNVDIVLDPDVQLLYSKPSQLNFISIYGSAEICTDEEIICNLYAQEDDNWFNGTDDPNLVAIKVVPKEAYYWDADQKNYSPFFKDNQQSYRSKRKTSIKKGMLEI